MMLKSILPLVAGFVLWLTPSCATKAADFNEVGAKMAELLREGHYARLPYNQKLSERFFQEYVDTLDRSKLYFLKTDVETFRRKYAKRLHTLLQAGEALPAATEIFELFLKRVEERTAMAKEILANNTFSFNGERWVLNDREEAEWPNNEEEARQLWKDYLEEALLSETLRRDQIEERAREQGKESPLKNELTPKEKILRRYERTLKFFSESDGEDVANFFFSAVANSYDPHTEYLSARELEQFRIGVSNELTGIGAVLSAQDDGSTKIEGIVNNGPADRQGDLKLGDRVVAVDSSYDNNWVDIMFMSLDKVVEMIRGKPNTSVGLKVEPADGAPGETRIIVIEREVVTMKDSLASAEIYQYGEGDEVTKLGFLRIPSFYFDYEDRSKRVSVDVEALLKRLSREKIDGLAIDLRRNGGGSLDEVRRLTGFFVGSGPVVQVKATTGHIEPLRTKARKPLYSGPLVVLTDKGSASASEILAGALQDYNRAVVIGESSTFGKGTVQQPFDIDRFMPPGKGGKRSGYVKLTIQKFYRVSGDSTQKKGVVPDIILPSTSDAQEFGEEHADFALPFDRIRPAAGFRPYNRHNLFLPVLQEKSRARVLANTDFRYVREDIQRIKKRLEEKRSSLNREVRLKEIAENDKRRKTRNKERIERFTEVAEQDVKELKIFRLNLDDIAKDTLPEVDRERDRELNMRRIKDEIADLDDTPEWPSGIDHEQREVLAVLTDLVQATQAGKVAGVLEKQ